MSENTNISRGSRARPGLTSLLGCTICFLLVVSSAAAMVDRATTVPVEDSIDLATRVYLPDDTGVYPAVLIRTPYSGAWLEDIAARFTAGGYATVIQDVRGMGKSGGAFMPFVHEQADGVATLQWLVSQPWSDGRVALWGVSYLAYCALETARAERPEVRAVVNISGWTDLSTFLTRGGAFRLVDQLPWLIAYAGGQTQIPDQAWAGIFRATPLMQYFGGVADEVGAAIDPSYNYAGLTIPILHITGWQDYIAPNTLDAFLKTRSHSPASKIILGPWTHNQVFDRDSTTYGDADFGPTAKMGLDSLLVLSLAWFDRHVIGNRIATDSQSTATYFVQNARLWRESPAWPPPDAETTVLYLVTPENDNSLRSTPPEKPSTLSYSYDPNDPVPTIGGPISFRRPFNVGVKDQSVLEGRADILFFESAPLDQAMRLAGPVTVELYAATDSVDTDFTAKLVEERPDGYARMIADGIVRARYRTGADSAVFVTPKHVYPYTIDLGHTAYEVAAGSRLRLEISSGNFPKYDRNPNDATDPFEATSFRTAQQTVFMSQEHPSSLTLTVLPGE